MLKIQLLGKFAASVDDRAVDLPLRAAQNLLAYLVLSAGRPHRREQLAGLLWPEVDGSSAKGYLRHTLWRLRKALGECDVLLADDLTLAFDARAAYWLDADEISKRPDARATPDELIRAVSVYEGDLLPGFYDEWVLLERERLQSSFESWMTLLLDRLVAAERWDDVLVWGERWISLGLTPEAAFRALITAHGHRGDASSAAATYRRCVEALQSELGVEPSAQTRAAYLREIAGEGSPLSDTASPRPLRGYQIEQRIGAGALGEVYRALQPDVGRHVAIKIIAPSYADHPEFIRLFESEARLVAQLEHPHIVPLIDYWREPGGAYLVTRWLPRNLRALLAAGPLDPATALGIAEQIGSALAAVHRHGLAHLDLKPDNILLDDEGNAYLGDFGLAHPIASFSASPSARLAQTVYAAPEQRQGESVTARADLYSLGLILYEMLSGCEPRAHAAAGDEIDTLERLSLPSLAEMGRGLSGQVDRVVQRAIARDPESRYPDVTALLAEVSQALRVEPAPRVDPLERILNPYKGLRAFEEADAPDFFGRDALIARLLERLRKEDPGARLVTLVGPSGCGKSSVVRAGLIPALRRGAFPGSDRSFIVQLTPGDHPLQSLENALVAIAARPPAGLREHLRTDPRGLLWAAETVLGDVDGDLLLVIDQFEELDTLVRSDVVRTTLLDLLSTAAAEPAGRVRIVLTLRADFLDGPLRHPTFGELLRPGLELVLPLAPQELARAVVGPATRVGIRVEDDLLAAIVADVSEEPGALPMLQYALTETFERREGRAMTLDAYHEAGGVAGALARRADDVYAALDESGQAAARQMFLRLVTLGEGAEDTRRRVLRSELATLDEGDSSGRDSLDDSPGGPGARALDAFGRARLLAFDRDAATRSPTVEVVHEALLREWPRLRHWLRDSRGEVRLQRQVAQAAAEWEAGRRETGFLLAGARLAQVEAWQPESTVALTLSERAFLDASRAERDRQARAEAERQAREIALERRSRRNLQALVGVLLVATVIAAGLAWWANANLAMSEAQRLAAESTRLFIENREYETAALLALRSLDLGYTPQGDEALSRAARQVYAEQLYPGHKGGVTLVALSADGQRVAIAEPLLPPIVRDVKTGAVLLRLDALPMGADAADLSADGHVLATGKDNTLRVWDVDSGRELYHRTYLNSVAGVDISEDGQILLVVGWDRLAHVMDLLTGEEKQRLRQPDALLAGRVSPDDRWVLTGDVNGRLWLWDWRAGETRFELTVVGWPWGLDFAPDMSTFSAASYDKVAYIFETATGQLLHEIPHEDELNATMDYSPDGRYILTGDQRGVAHLWDVQTGTEARRFLHNVAVASGQFSADGRLLVTAAQDGSVRFWNLQTLPVQLEIPGAGHTEGKLAFTSDGNQLFAQGRVFDSHTGAPGPDTHVFGFSALSRDGGTAFVLNLDPFELRVLDPRTWETRLNEPVGCMDEPYGIGLSPDGSLIGLGSYGTPYQICVVDSRSGELIRTIDIDAVITSLAFTADNGILAVGGCNETARLFDLATGQLIRSLRVPTGSNCINEIAVSPDGSQVATAGFGGNVEIWSITTGQQLQAFVGHTDTVWGVAFSPDGRSLLTSSGDGTARLWDIASGDERRRFSGHTASVWRAAFSPDGRWVATTSSDNSVKLWLTDLDDLKASVCDTLPRDLSDLERERYGISSRTLTCEPRVVPATP